jgi:hypothetical protein
MPPYEDKGIYSGEDLAKLLLEYMPNCKITLCSLSFKDKNNHKKYKSNGLVIKNDLTFDELLFALIIKTRNVLQSISY